MAYRMSDYLYANPMVLRSTQILDKANSIHKKWGLLFVPSSRNSRWCRGYSPSEKRQYLSRLIFSEGMDPLRPLDIRVIPNMNEYLFHGCIKRSVVLKPTWREVHQKPSPTIVTIFSPLASSILPWRLLLFSLSFVRLQTGSGIPLSPDAKGIFSVHVLLCLHHEVNHTGRGVLGEGEYEFKGQQLSHQSSNDHLLIGIVNL